MSDIKFIMAQRIDLMTANPPLVYTQPLIRGNASAHEWQVAVVKNGQPVDLTGCSVTCYAARGDKKTVRVKGAADGCIASVTFDQSFYAIEGDVAAEMEISNGDGQIVSIAVLYYRLQRLATDTIIDPENEIESLEALMAQIDEMKRVTQEAEDAIAQLQANMDKADEAVDKAEEAVATVQGWTDIQVVCNTLEAGSEATVTLIENEDGSKTLMYGIPKGDAFAYEDFTAEQLEALRGPQGEQGIQGATGLTGATPQISVEVTTGEPGTEAAVSVSGTAENPVIHLTIPRGETGAVEGLDYYDDAPKALGTAAAGTSAYVARGDHVHPLPTELQYDGGSQYAKIRSTASNRTKSVSVIDPDTGEEVDLYIETADSGDILPVLRYKGTDGNVRFYKLYSSLNAPTASDVGALAEGGTAADANKLGGKEAAYYTPYANLADNSDFEHWISQAGIGGLHGTQGYGGDRWILESGTITGEENADGSGFSNITLNGTLVQVVASPPDTATPFVEMVSGEAEITYDASVGEISITSAGGVIKSVLLLPGEWSVKPPYVSRGYAVEQAVCKDYYNRIASGALAPVGFGNMIWSSTLCRITLADAPAMRVTPTITMSNGEIWLGSTRVDVTTVSSVYMDNNITLDIVISTQTQYIQATMYADVVELNADLQRRSGDV